MIQRVQGQFYEMGFHLLSGIIVDEELKEKLQVVLDEAREKICKVIDENREHLKETETSSVYPFGKQTDINYIAPKSSISLTLEQRKKLLDIALNMKKVENVFECDFLDIEKIKAFAQRTIEDEQMKQEETGGHE